MTIRAFALAVVLGALSATSSLAATVTLNVVGGQLLGAYNVDVDGTLYDVEFVDGSCVTVFGGCDSASDFAFSTFQQARAAAQSLIETVFLDGPLGDFDSDPGLTVGIEESRFGNTGDFLVPYGFDPARTDVFRSAFVRNRSALNDDVGDGPAPALSSFDFTNANTSAFARFTPADIAVVPLPAAGGLLLAGLAGLGALRARRHTVASR